MHKERKTQGFSLIVVMVMLVALSILGVAGYTAATSSSRSGATWDDRQRSLYLTESTFQKAEQDVLTNFADWKAGTKVDTYFKKRSEAYNTLKDFSTTGGQSTSIEGDNKVAKQNARYLIVWETELGPIYGKDRVTIYAQSAGARTDSNTVVSATYEVADE